MSYSLWYTRNEPVRLEQPHQVVTVCVQESSNTYEPVNDWYSIVYQALLSRWTLMFQTCYDVIALFHVNKQRYPREEICSNQPMAILSLRRFFACISRMKSKCKNPSSYE